MDRLAATAKQLNLAMCLHRLHLLLRCGDGILQATAFLLLT